MRRDIIVVDDLQYERSEVGLARQLGRCPGVVRLDVDPRAGLADILYEESRTSPDRLRELIAQYGYTLPKGVGRSPVRDRGRSAFSEQSVSPREDRIAQLR